MTRHPVLRRNANLACPAQPATFKVLQSPTARGALWGAVSPALDRFESGFAWASIPAGSPGGRRDVGSGGGDNTPSESGSPPASDRLDSWKEIAAYLRRGVSTVQRWEKEEGLPTHRLHHGKLGSVYAFKSELDAWVRDRRERIAAEGEVTSPENGPGPGPPPDAPVVPGSPRSRPRSPPWSPPPAPAGKTPARRRLLGPGLGLAGAGLVGLLLVVSRFLPPPSPTASPGPPRTYPITSSRGLERHPALSPDGRQLAYVSNDAGETFDLYVKEVDSPRALRLTTSAASECCPAWSPDQRSIGLPASRGKRGGAPDHAGRGGSGGAHGLGLTPGSAPPSAIHRTAGSWPTRTGPLGRALRGEAARARHGRGAVAHPAVPAFSGDAFPKFSPDGRQVAFARLSRVAGRGRPPMSTWFPVEGGEPRRLTRDQRFVGDLEWTPDGREILFFSDRTARPSASGGWRWPGASPRWCGRAAIPSRRSPSPKVSWTCRTRSASRRPATSSRLALTQRVYDTNIFRLDPRAPLRRLPAPHRLEPGGREPAGLPRRPPDRVLLDALGRSRRSGSAPRRLGLRLARADPQRRNPALGPGQPVPRLRRLVARGHHTPTSSPSTCAPSRCGASRPDDADDVVPSFSRDGRSIYFASNRTGSWQVFRTSVQGGRRGRSPTRGGSPPSRPRAETRSSTRGSTLRGSSGCPGRAGRRREWLDRPRCWGQWTMAPDGIYLLDSREGQKTRLEFVGFGGSPPREIATLAQRPPCAESSLAASPDGAFLLWVRGCEESSDIAGGVRRPACAHSRSAL